MVRFCKTSPYLMIALGLISASVDGHAQTPNIGDALRQVEPPQRQQKNAPSLPFDGEFSLQQPVETQNDEKIDVKNFLFANNTVIPSEELDTLTEKYENKDMSLAELQFVTDTITQHYRAKGYFVARAFLPPQDVLDGVVTIQISEGNLGAFNKKNASLIKDSVVQNILDGVPDGALNSKPLERTLMVINNLPGATVTNTEIAAGKELGTADLSINVDKTSRMNGFLIADNYGSSYTGRRRMMAGVDINSPLGIGDKLSLSGLITEGQYLKNYRVAYGSLLHPSGLIGEISAARTSYHLTSDFKNLDAVGTAQSYDAKLSYPFVFTRDLIITGTAGVTHKDLRDDIQSTNTKVPKSINSISPGVEFDFDHDVLGIQGRSTAGINMTFGHLDIKDADSAQLDEAGADTQGNFAKSNFYAAHQMQFNPQWSLSMSARGQHAFGKNLDGSEDMSISGLNGVKVYPADEFSAENAYLGSTELLYLVPTTLPVSLRIGPFADIGYARVENKIGDNSSRTLSNVGIAAYMGYENVFLNAHLATATTDEAESDNVSDTRGFMQMGVRF